MTDNLRPSQFAVKPILHTCQQSARLPSDMGKRLGSPYQITDEWKRQVVAELKRRAMKRKALAAIIGVHPSTITLSLRLRDSGKPSQETSRIANRIADALRIPLPMTVSAELEAVLPHLRRLKERNPELYAHVVALISNFDK